MSWQGILGHDDVVEQFRLALARQRLASSFLFVGPAGIGKRTFAARLAQALLCRQRPAADLDPCGQCSSCVQVAADTHPDLVMVDRPKDKSFLPLELLIGDKDHRGRQGLCHAIAMKPFMGGRKVAILDDADYLNAEGANSLLKTLEEPPPRSVLILIGTSPAKQLPTIRSRCQVVRFRALPSELVAELLLSQNLVESPEEARRLASHSGGSLERALELTGDELWQFRLMLQERLSEPGLDGVSLAEAVSAFVSEAGSEAARRRARMRQVFEFAAEFYRYLIRGLSGAAGMDDTELEGRVRRALQHWPTDDAAAAACLDRSISAIDELERNAYQPTLLECWIDDVVKTRLLGHAPLR